MKFIFVFVFISSSIFAQDNCAIIERLYEDASYIEQIKQDLAQKNKKDSSENNQQYKTSASIGSLYAGSYASFKMKRIGESVIYNTKQQIKAAKAADNLVSIKHLESYLTKSKMMRKSFKVLGWAFLIGGTMHLAKSYLEADFEDGVELMVDLDNSEDKERLCEIINLNVGAREIYKQYSLKLFIARSKIENLITKDSYINKSTKDTDKKIEKIINGLDSNLEIAID